MSRRIGMAAAGARCRRTRGVVALLAVAIVASAFVVTQVASASPSRSRGLAVATSGQAAGVARRAASCNKSNIVVLLLFNSTHHAPNTVSPAPNGCWTWADERSDLAGIFSNTYYICSVNPWSGGPSWHTYGSSSAPIAVYDDTNTSHNSSGTTDNTEISRCLAPPRSLYLNIEYQAPVGCGASWLSTHPSNVTVGQYYAETYCSDTSRDSGSLVSAFPANSTHGGVANVGPDITSQANMTSDIAAVCNRTASNGAMTLYEASYAEVTTTAQSWINAALNSCFH